MCNEARLEKEIRERITEFTFLNHEHLHVDETHYKIINSIDIYGTEGFVYMCKKQKQILSKVTHYCVWVGDEYDSFSTEMRGRYILKEFSAPIFFIGKITDDGCSKYVTDVRFLTLKSGPKLKRRLPFLIV